MAALLPQEHKALKVAVPVGLGLWPGWAMRSGRNNASARRRTRTWQGKPPVPTNRSQVRSLETAWHGQAAIWSLVALTGMELNMKTNVYDQGRSPTVLAVQCGRETSGSENQSAEPKQVRQRGSYLLALIMLILIPDRRRYLSPHPVVWRRGNHTSQRTVLCIASAGGAAYRERQRVYHPGCVSVRFEFAPSAARLAPHRWAACDPLRPGGGTFRFVDDLVLSLA